MKLRVCMAALAAAGFLSALLPGAVFAKSHHHTDSSGAPHASHRHRAEAAAKQAQAAHLARLAAQEKAAWRLHLAKLRALPPRKRLAVKRHDRKVQEAAQQKADALARQAQAEKRAWRQHLAKVAALSPRKRRAQRLADAIAAQQAANHHAVAKAAPKITHFTKVAARRPKVAPAVAAHNARLARSEAAHQAKVAQAQAAHNARLAAHNARLAKINAAHQAKVQAQQRLAAERALNHQLRLSKQQAQHNARLAAQRAHEVALQGDGTGGRSIHFWQTEAAGVPVKCITVDLNDSNVKVSAVMAVNGNGTSEPFRQMIQRANPNVAVTGTFFSLDNLHPVGDIVIDGSLVHFGGMGTALCVTPGNRADMVTVEWGRHHDWSPYDFVVACGPRLLRRGRIVLDPRAERFRDAHMLAPNSRIAVGITPGNKIVFAMTHEPIYLGRLAKVMQQLGATEAMNLDAGTSTGFYYNGATLAKPGRKLTNMIVVYGRKERYERALDQLVPAAYRRATTRYAHRQVSMLVNP